MALAPKIRTGSLEDQARTDATKARNAQLAGAPAGTAPVAVPPVGTPAPRNTAFDNFGAAGVSATAPAPAGQRLPIDFKTAGFASQAEYNTAEGTKPIVGGTSTPVVQVGGVDASSRLPSPSWTAAQNAATAQAAQIRANTPVPMTQQQGFALGNAIRGSNIDAANAAAARPAQDSASSRQANVAAARKGGTFDKIREEYNKAHGATHLMDSAGDIHQLNDASRLKIAADTVKQAAATTKLAHTTQMAHATTINDKLKEAVGAQKAAEAATAGSPQTVGQNIAGLFGIAPITPAFQSAPSLEPASALTGIRQNDVAIQAPAVAPVANPIFNTATGGPLRNTMRLGGLLPAAATQASNNVKSTMDTAPNYSRLP